LRRIAAIITILTLCVHLPAETLDRSKLDSLFANLADHNLAEGSLAISSYGKLVYQRSFGRDQTPQTEYRIGSISKVFTAVLIYELVDERRLSLDDKLSKFFPNLPNADRITIAELLGHRSGLANFTNHTGFDDWKDKPKTHAELLALIQNQQPDFEPGARADYNNSNYLLLSYIVEQVTGEDYKTVLGEKILQRAHLDHTYYGDRIGFQPGEAISYRFENGAWKQDRAACLDNFCGAGAIISTPQDMLTFIGSLFAGEFISRESLAQMTMIRDGYGKGIFPYGDANHVGYGHNGKTEGFGSSLQYYPDSHLAIAYCTNGEVYPKAEILDRVFKISLGIPCEIPTFKPRIIDAASIARLVGSYTSADKNIQATTIAGKGNLVISVKGQPFPLVALSDHEFWNIPFGFFFNFSGNGEKLTLKDVDDVYELRRSGPSINGH
jgi:CubicO group peptidase (beta-lactamase class C family)